MATTIRLNHTAFFYCYAEDYDGYNITFTWQFNGHPIDFHLNPEYIMVCLLFALGIVNVYRFVEYGKQKWLIYSNEKKTAINSGVYV